MAPLVRLRAALLASGLAFLAVAALFDVAWRPGRYPAPADEQTQREVLAALVDYDRIYEDFFASGGQPALLDAFPATKAMKNLVFRDLGYLRSAGLVMVQDLAQATLVEVKRVAPDAAEAIVFEEWNYLLERASDRRPVLIPKGLGQGFKYQLRREEGSWRVAGWEVHDMTPPADPELFKW